MRKAIASAALLIILGIFLITSSPIGLHPFGEPLEEQRLTDLHYIERTRADTGSNNVVTAVLFDYRGYDTLGEATVLFAAIIGCAAILGAGIRREPGG